MAQTQWLSKFALFDFDIKYRTGKSNQAANTLSHHLKTDHDKPSNNDSEEYKTIVYAVVCDDLCDIIKGENYP